MGVCSGGAEGGDGGGEEPAERLGGCILGGLAGR